MRCCGYGGRGFSAPAQHAQTYTCSCTILLCPLHAHQWLLPREGRQHEMLRLQGERIFPTTTISSIYKCSCTILLCPLHFKRLNGYCRAREGSMRCCGYRGRGFFTPSRHPNLRMSLRHLMAPSSNVAMATDAWERQHEMLRLQGGGCEET